MGQKVWKGSNICPPFENPKLVVQPAKDRIDASQLMVAAQIDISTSKRWT